MKEAIMILLKGLFMGAADIIPGVSGGTIALITGIYERLVKGISGAFNHGGRALAEIFRGEWEKSWKEILKVDFKFFIPLIIGIWAAFLSLSRAITYLLTEQKALVFAFFLGLILASAWFVYKGIKEKSLGTALSLAAGLVFAYFFVGLNPLQANHSAIVIFLSGVVSITAMLLPGISGSFIILLLGQYEFMINAVSNLQLRELATFMAGGAVGLLIFSKIISLLLKKYKPETLAFITGLMVGSLRLPLREIASVEYSLFTTFLFAVIGGMMVFVLEKLSKNL